MFTLLVLWEDKMISQLKLIRNRLLESKDIDTYKIIISFLDLPNENLIKDIIYGFPKEFGSIITETLNELINIYETDATTYRTKIIYGQRIIWDQVLNCYEVLESTKKKIELLKIRMYDDDYLKACKEVTRIFELYAEAQIKMSKFEDALGIDRYLDTLCADDIKPLENLMAEIKVIFENKIAPYKAIFTDKWSTTNIASIIKHQLIKYNGENTICTLFECNKKKTVLFIIDGFGFGQYQWHKNMHKDSKNYTYTENIFAWLSKCDSIKEYILGSAYITDTGAGLAQIFSGKTAKETGIICSKIGKCNTNLFFETKRIDINSFKDTFQIETNSITEIVGLFGKASKVFYGSRYSGNNFGFSDFIFKGAEVIEVLPSERMFSILKDDLCEGKDGLDVVYLTGIDNSGHTMGAYSKFEKFEHEKFNMLFRNFLIEMAMEYPQYFDGKTTLLITADHGMAESSKLMINRKDIKTRFNSINIRNINFVENNRALLIYGLEVSNYEAAIACLKKYFDEIGVKVELLVKDTIDYNNLYTSNSKSKIYMLAPDIVVRLIGNGLFYSKETSPHLLHYGGHGGNSAGETFVPLLQITLNSKLLQNIINRFINLL